MKNIFDRARLEERLRELRDLPPFEPEKYEPRFAVTQLFETGIECTLHYVWRDGRMVFYKSEQKMVSDEKSTR